MEVFVERRPDFVIKMILRERRMMKKLRQFLREHKETIIIGIIYRYLKIREKKRLLQLHPQTDFVSLERTQEIYRADKEWLQLVNGNITGRTLDVGSLYGLVTNGKDVVALDIIKTYLQQNIHDNKVLADASHIPFVNDTFDTVVSTEILEHLEQPKKAIAEINRVLKHNGISIMSVPNRYATFSEPTHIHYFTIKKVHKLFKQFREVCTVTVTGHIFGIFRMVNKVNPTESLRNARRKFIFKKLFVLSSCVLLTTAVFLLFIDLSEFMFKLLLGLCLGTLLAMLIFMELGWFEELSEPKREEKRAEEMECRELI